MIKTTLHFLREHWAAVAMGLCLSLLTAYPQLMFRFEHRADGIYRGIEIMPDDPWLPRVRELMDGHGFGSIYFKEGKDDPYLFQPLGSGLVAYPAKALGLTINDAILFFHIVFSALVFWAVYAFIILFSKEKWAALSGASVILFANGVLSISGLTTLLHGAPPTWFLDIDLPVNPAMIYFFIFAFLTAFWLYYERRAWYWGAMAAVLLGLNFYNYFYSWTYLFSFVGCMVLLYAGRREWREALRLAYVPLGAVVFAIPYGINLYRASQYPTFAEVGMRQGIIYSHAPLFIGFLVLGALVTYLVFFPRHNKQPYILGLALLLAPFVTLNQQLLTGKVMQPGHYHWYLHKPLAVILLLVLVFYFLSKFKPAWLKPAAAGTIALFCLGVGVFTQVQSYYYDPSDGGAVAITRQDYGPVMDWLNIHAQKDQVLLGNNETSYITTIYTPLNVFYHRADLYSLSSTDARLRDILLTLYRLRGIRATDAPKVFEDERGFISLNLYGIYYRDLMGSYAAMPQQDLDDFVALYEAQLEEPMLQWLGDMLRKYEVNWVVWDTQADPDWHLERYPTLLKKEAQFGRLVIYSVRP